MSAISPIDQAFINRLTGIIRANLENENFGVAELAHASGMLRLVIYHRLMAITGKSTTQFIREVRLQRAMEMLRQGSTTTASEVAYQVGFGSPAYFNTCFHEYFGYPPGEVLKSAKQESGEIDLWLAEEPEVKESEPVPQHTKKSGWSISVRQVFIYSSIIILVFIGMVWMSNLAVLKTPITLPLNRINNSDKSIAVLPFISLSSEVENKYFAEGVTRNILYNLIQISEITVINSPAKEFEGNTPDFKKMVGKLNVRFFLSGSVQKSGEQVLVMAQLTDITKNQIIWSEKFSRKLSDIFQIQSDIANRVATNLQSVIAKKEKKQIEKIPTQNMEAHAWYVMGRYLLDRRSFRDEKINKYIAPFKNAIAADPEYAEAYVGLADVYLTATRTLSYPSPEGFLLAKENVLKAMELDSSIAEAHAILGEILYLHEWKWEDARKELANAIGLNPNSAEAHRYYSDLMNTLRKRELARFHCFKAVELNPVSQYLILAKAKFLEEDGKYDDALEEYKKVIELFPGYSSVYWYLWNFYRKTNQELKAVEAIQKAFQLVPDERKFVDTIKVVYDKYGMKGLEKWLNEYSIRYDDKGSWRGVAVYYCEIGEKEKALDWLDKAYEWKVSGLPSINAMPEFNNLRNEPRFQELLGKMGLTAYQ
ncbi:MAG: helix-turn-helix domain-containing protein [Mariniphaga sp.]